MTFEKQRLEKTKTFLTFIAHIFFGFDMFFLIKGIKLSVRETEDISISQTGLRNIIYASIGNIKFINKMKYFLTSLGQLASLLTGAEKTRVEALTKQFSVPYFLKT